MSLIANPKLIKKFNTLKVGQIVSYNNGFCKHKSRVQWIRRYKSNKQISSISLGSLEGKRSQRGYVVLEFVKLKKEE